MCGNCCWPCWVGKHTECRGPKPPYRCPCTCASNALKASATEAGVQP